MASVGRPAPRRPTLIRIRPAGRAPNPGHWGIEALRDIRDTTFAKDACKVFCARSTRAGLRGAIVVGSDAGVAAKSAG
jgi:hypothetical protein